MNKTIIAVTLTGLLQVCAIGGLISFLFNSANDTAYEYSLAAENSAVKRSHEELMNVYKTIQNERIEDRNETREWLDRQLTLRFVKSNIPTGELKQ